MPQTIITQKKDQTLEIILNRPEVRNAFNETLIQELTEVFDKNWDQEKIRLIHLKGNGPCFSAGADLNWMKKAASYSREENIEDALKLSKLLQKMNHCPLPLLTSVHGAVLGGGMGLISVSDYVISSSETKFGFTEVHLGIIPATIGPFVLNKIGKSHARALFLSGERFGAQKAYDISCVHEIVAKPEDLESKAEKKIEIFLKASPAAQKSAKKFISQLEEESDPYQKSAEILAELRGSSEGQEGIQAFLEKRKAHW